MNIVGIIAEFNPMHNGHKYLIQKAKEITGCDTALCIMSGNFTQAGNIAIKDKYTRANIAIENGFDIVIELPTIYATSSAEYFSKGAIEILNSLPIKYICFGSETGDTNALNLIAEKLVRNNDLIWENITETLKSGISFAKAREYSLNKILSKDEIEISTKSNNILAIEYLKNLIKLNSNIKPIAIKRDENVISATNIRDAIKENSNIKEIEKNILSSDNILHEPILNNSMFNAIKYAILSLTKEQLKDIAQVTEGLENKIYDELNSFLSYEEFIQNIKSKRYQLSKIKRILNNILLNITKDEFIKLQNSNKYYAHVIAINQNRKKEILSFITKNSSIPIITSINEKVLKDLDELSLKSLKLDIKASNIYSIFSNDTINKDYTNKI